MAAGGNKPKEMDIHKGSGIEELEQEITCPICHCHFQDPKILPCCHYYCKKCIQALAWRAGANQPFSCPECRSEVLLPQNDPEKLLTAFFVNRLKEVHSKMEKVQGKVDAMCELCTGGRASAFCRQCAEFICDKCTEAHQRMKTFAGHQVSSLDELKMGGTREIATKQPPPLTCKVHDEQMKMFCYDCECLICRDCILDDHTDHRYEFVRKAAPIVKSTLAEHSVSMRQICMKLNNAKKTVELVKSDVINQGASIAASIEQSFQELFHILEQRKQNLLSEAFVNMGQKLNRLNRQEKGINTASGVIQSLIEFMERNIENATEEELMSIHTHMLKRIEEETKKHQQSSADLLPVEEANMGVRIKLTKELKSLCREKSSLFVSPFNLSRCAVSGLGVKSAEIGKSSEVHVQIEPWSNSYSQHEKLITVEGKLKSHVDESVVQAESKQKEGCTYEYIIEYTPIIRGRHTLEITVNGQPIVDSPFPIVVKMPLSDFNKPGITLSRLIGYGVAFNSFDEMVFIEQDGDILLLDGKGNRLRSMKRAECGFLKLFGVAIDDNDDVYVTDYERQCVFKINSNFTSIKDVKPALAHFSPRGITVFDNEVIVADSVSNQLVFFTRDLDLIRVIDSHSNKPVGVACDHSGNIYVCDFGGDCIQVLNANGKHLYSFRDKSIESGSLREPHSICIDSSELVYVSEWRPNHCVSVFTKEGKFLASLGTKGNDEGQFKFPSGIAFDCNGILCVCDQANSRLQLF